MLPSGFPLSLRLQHGAGPAGPGEENRGGEGWDRDVGLPGPPVAKDLQDWAALSWVLASSTDGFGCHKIFIISIFAKLPGSSPCRIGCKLQKHLSGTQLTLSEELNRWGTQAHPSGSALLAAPVCPCVGPAGGVVAAQSSCCSRETCLGAVGSLSKQLTAIFWHTKRCNCPLQECWHTPRLLVMCLDLADDPRRSSYPSEEQQSLNLHRVIMLTGFNPATGRVRNKRGKAEETCPALS